MANNNVIYKEAGSGVVKTIQIDPSYGVSATVATDQTELIFTVSGPAGETKEDTIGGRSRRD